MPYPVPNITIMVSMPPAERTAMPLSAAPLVQPRPNCAPNPNSNPPTPANIRRVVLDMRGPFSSLNPNRPDMAPEKNAPANAPSERNTSQFLIGLTGPVASL